MKSILIALSILMIPCLPSSADQLAAQVEGPRDTCIFQVEPTILDERYSRSGRSEKTLQLPGVLPPEAPIPDAAPAIVANAATKKPAKKTMQWTEASRDTNMFQVEPTILNERYYRSGLAERHLKLPGVLAAGAPIPNETAPVTPAIAQKPATKSTWAEAPRDTNFFQLEPTILNEEHYRSGRAEKTLQLPGILPANAPIPDNV